MRLTFAVFLIFSLVISFRSSADADYSVGVYYFPRWIEMPGEAWSPPWDKIRKYPEREPLLGFYREGETTVAEKQIEWMHAYGIDFIIYDWYWNREKGAYLEHAINAYLRAKNRNLVRYAILWANHTTVPENIGQYDAIIDHWINNHFKQKGFLQIDRKPVVFIFAPQRLAESAKRFGSKAKELLDRARERARASGLQGIYFVACTQALERPVKDELPRSGYDAISAYNYHRGYSGRYEEGGLSANYAELAAGYAESWKWILDNSRLPYFVPVTSGWNSRPWGGNAPHDNSISTPDSFGQHLIEARSLCDRFPRKTLKTIVVCCWNEFGEGSYIEPTKKWQFQYLQRIKDVFGQ